LSPASTPHNGRHPTLKKLENIENKKTECTSNQCCGSKTFLLSFSNVKSHKEVVNNIEETMGKLTIFFLIIERSRSILLTNGSGFRRPKNMRILIFFLSGSHFYPINDRTTKKGLGDKLLKSVEI
jgi:hypothetical protein